MIRTTDLPGRTATGARPAGFQGVDAVGPYLRSLIAYHRDTLAVPVE